MQIDEDFSALRVIFFHEFVRPCCRPSQGKLDKTLKQIPYQNIVVPRSCIRSGLATHLFTHFQTRSTSMLSVHLTVWSILPFNKAPNLFQSTNTLYELHIHLIQIQTK